MNKAIVILTNFWDADNIIDNGSLIVEDVAFKKIYKIDFVSLPETNFTIHSIALTSPQMKSKRFDNITRLDFFCPTYDMLKRYKEDKNWDKYVPDYKELLRCRKDNIRRWIISLKPNHVYILCCWENTSKGAHCHREILHKAFLNSSTARNNIISVYRHGSKDKKKNSRPFVIMPQSDFVRVRTSDTEIPF